MTTDSHTQPCGHRSVVEVPRLPLSARPNRHDSLDVHPIDSEQLEEIELTTELTIAARSAAERLDQATIDAILGLHPQLKPL